MWPKLRRHLGVKLFVSYLVVIVIGLGVQAVAAEIALPSAFQRHMANMQAGIGVPGGPGGMMGNGGNAGGRGLELYSNFRAGVNEALAVAAVAALLAAFVASIFISRRVVAPVQAITHASQRIADGHYDYRVPVPSGAPHAVDELGQLAHAFNQMAERLEHTEQMRRELLGDVSHELRTPLTAIKGSMEGLMDGVLAAEPATFQRIEDEADRLQRLVSDLQELSRVEAGAYVLDRQPVAMDALVKTAVERVAPQYQQKQIVLSAQLTPHLPPVQGDADRLLQVLLNLLSNACQYTPDGGVVQIKAGLQAHEVVVAVSDNGVGIPAEHISHLFTRFYRVDKSRSRQAGGGSGIGLAIAKHLVEAHGGRIWAQSDGDGKGSTFTFALPVGLT
jgi:signal transduction histidine kinase